MKQKKTFWSAISKELSLLQHFPFLVAIKSDAQSY